MVSVLSPHLPELASGSSEFDTLDLTDLDLEEIPARYLRANGSYHPEKVTNLILAHNQCLRLSGLQVFKNLQSLDVSNNQLTDLPAELADLPHLKTIIARNNLLEGFPKTYVQLRGLETLNLSGNRIETIPPFVFSLHALKVLHLGANHIEQLPYAIGTLSNLTILYLGGNRLRDVPATIGRLSRLTLLALSDNELETIPPTVAELQSLESLALHNNHIRTLPTEIVKLRNLQQLSLRNNPLVHQFVSNMEFEPASLKELAGRIVRRKTASKELANLLPDDLVRYIRSANQCVNPNCKGVYFDACVEHVKFVDFCGKYRVPLLQFLCSNKCKGATPAFTSDAESSEDEQPGSSYQQAKLKKVLLG